MAAPHYYIYVYHKTSTQTDSQQLNHSLLLLPTPFEEQEGVNSFQIGASRNYDDDFLTSNH
jgi:uncharacterized membrane-anchored protein